MAAELHETDRRAIFLQIVLMQDEGLSVNDSRNRVAENYGVNEEAVCEIESEGIAKEWPPLRDPAE